MNRVLKLALLSYGWMVDPHHRDGGGRACPSWAHLCLVTDAAVHQLGEEWTSYLPPAIFEAVVQPRLAVGCLTFKPKDEGTLELLDLDMHFPPELVGDLDSQALDIIRHPPFSMSQDEIDAMFQHHVPLVDDVMTLAQLAHELGGPHV
jgi:hypothetical protein